MYHSVKVLTVILFMTEINAESIEEHQQGYAPSTLNFDDIYTNSLSTLTEEPSSTSVSIDELNLNNIPTQLEEFHPQATTNFPITIPPPKYPSREALMVPKENFKTVETTTTTTEEPEESSVKVIPIEKEYQRGVLDLLFPATRTVISAEPTQEIQQGFIYNSYYSQPSLNFDDTSKNGLSVTEGTLNTTSIEEFNLNIPIHFVEFNPQTVTNPPLKIPLPKFISIEALMKTKENHKVDKTTTTTEGPEETLVKVVPMKKEYRRGVLDLLFPATRVRSFKTLFDFVRRILSGTFR